MYSVRRSIQVALLSLGVVGIVACDKSSVTGVGPKPAVASDLVLAEVYANNFNTGVGANLSANAHITTSPNATQTFLGEYGNDTVTLSLTGLGAHDSVFVNFDLYIIRSWDGADATWGGQPFGTGGDEFMILADGVTRMDATFGNVAQVQSFPDLPGVDIHAATNAGSFFNSLGYTYWSGTVPCDTHYELSVAFAHTAATLELKFIGKGLQSITDESWGIDLVSVNTIQCTGATVCPP